MPDINENRPGYKKTRIGWIPNDWKIVQLGAMTSKIGSGSTPRGGDKVYTKQGIVFIRSQNVNGNRLLLDDIKYIPAKVHASMAGTIVKSNDVLLNITGASIGRSCVVPMDFNEGNVNQHVCIIRPNDSLKPYFLQAYLASFKGQKAILRSQVGGNREGLNHSNVRQLKLPLPPLPEQKKIAAILSTWDAAIQKLEQLIDKKRALKRGLMQQLLTGQRRFPEFVPAGGTRYKRTKLGLAPVDWEVGQLGQLLKSVIGGGTPSRENSAYWNGQIPWCTVKDLKGRFLTSTEEYITEAGVRSSATKIIPAGTIIVATRMAVGKAVVFDKAVAINQDLKAIIPQKTLDSRFLHYWFDARQKHFERIGVGSTVAGIKIQDIRKAIIAQPPLNEQNRIIKVLSNCDKEITCLEKERMQLVQQKKGLMQQLLTGAVRVKTTVSQT